MAKETKKDLRSGVLKLTVIRNRQVSRRLEYQKPTSLGRPYESNGIRFATAGKPCQRGVERLQDEIEISQQLQDRGWVNSGSQPRGHGHQAEAEKIYGIWKDSSDTVFKRIYCRSP